VLHQALRFDARGGGVELQRRCQFRGIRERPLL
jgi:hypothetical protein